MTTIHNKVKSPALSRLTFEQMDQRPPSKHILWVSVVETVEYDTGVTTEAELSPVITVQRFPTNFIRISYQPDTP